MQSNVTDPSEMIEYVSRAIVAKDYDSLLSYYEAGAVLVRPDDTEAVGHDAIGEVYESYVEKVTGMTGKARKVKKLSLSLKHL
jgi:ketosteroid isomerase-like protein